MTYEVLAESGELEISESSRIKLQVKKAKEDSIGLDIRLFVSTKKYTGPTRKGVFWPASTVEDVERFQAALDKLCEDAKKVLTHG